jgi:hypothetical protein
MPPLRAELVWDRQLVELTASAGDHEAVVSFHYRNPGNVPVTILTAEPSCTCTTVDLPTPVCPPGDTRELTVRINLTGLSGLQEKEVRITTNFPTDPPIILRVRVAIPELLTCAPAQLLWQPGEALTEKTIAVEAGTTDSITSVQIMSVSPSGWSVLVRPLIPGRKLQLRVQPASLRQTATVAIVCIAKFEHGAEHPFTILALVR